MVIRIEGNRLKLWLAITVMLCAVSASHRQNADLKGTQIGDRGVASPARRPPASCASPDQAAHFKAKSGGKSGT